MNDSRSLQRNTAVAERQELSVNLISGDRIEVEAVQWIWTGYLAAGKLHICAGVPATGKTTIALDLTATKPNGLAPPPAAVGRELRSWPML